MEAEMIDRPISDKAVKEIEFWKALAIDRAERITELKARQRQYHEALNAAYPLIVTYPGDSAPALALMRPLLEMGAAA